MRTEAAKAAAAIRKHLKAHGIKAKVKSSNFSMGSSVDITVYDQLPATHSKIETFCDQYQYGHFDGMTDQYHCSNTQDFPQAKYVFVKNEISDELTAQCYQWAKESFSCLQGAPEKIEDAHGFWMHQGNAPQFINQLLRETGPDTCWTQHKKRSAA